MNNLKEMEVVLRGVEKYAMDNVTKRFGEVLELLEDTIK